MRKVNFYEIDRPAFSILKRNVERTIDGKDGDGDGGFEEEELEGNKFGIF